MSALILIGCIIAYLIIAYFTGLYYTKSHINDICYPKIDNVALYTENDLICDAIFAGICWPGMLPYTFICNKYNKIINNGKQ